MKILVTGGAGFIGSALIRRALATTTHDILNVDKLSYSASLESLLGAAANRNYRFSRTDICDSAAVRQIFREFGPEAVVHLAAESHVDRSIDGPLPFIQTNVVGTCTLLEAARHYFENLSAERRAEFRFHHVSTDEVFGSLGVGGRFSEESRYAPRSPYSASKAASDHMVRAWHYTYGLPILVSNCSNNYGPYQFPEKLIPLMILRCLAGQELPVYGDGSNVRDWLFVEDHAAAILAILELGHVGESYNIGGDEERSNIEVVEAICDTLDELRPSDAGSYRRLIKFVADRPGHDFRYAVDSQRIREQVGWRPTLSFRDGLRYTVGWYLSNEAWWRPIMARRYHTERKGLAAVA